MGAAVQLPLFGPQPPRAPVPIAQPLGPSTTIEQAIAPYQDFLRGKGAAQNTLYNFTSDIRQLAAFYPNRPVRDISPSDLQRFLGALERHGTSRRSTCRKLVSLRSFFGFLVAQRALQHNPALAFSLPPEAQPRPLPITQQEAQRLLDATDSLMYRALVALFLYTGAKREEALSLSRADLMLEASPPSVRLHRLRHSRYNRERTVPAPEPLVRILGDYLATVQGSVLFPISPRSVSEACHRYSSRAGLDRTASPEMLRDTFAVAWLRGKLPLEQELEELGMAEAAQALRGQHDRQLQRLLGLSDLWALRMLPLYRAAAGASQP